MLAGALLLLATYILAAVFAWGNRHPATIGGTVVGYIVLAYGFATAMRARRGPD